MSLSEFLEIIQPHHQIPDVYVIRSMCISKELISDIFSDPEHFKNLINKEQSNNDKRII